MLKVLAAAAALTLVACGPADTALRAPDGGLFNIQCKDGTTLRECNAAKLYDECKNHKGGDLAARPNGIVAIEKCVGFDCCYWPDGGRF